jgi:MFS family permease
MLRLGIYRTIVAICAAGFLEAILYGFSFPYFSLVLENRDASALLIGLNSTVGALAVVAIGPAVPFLIVKFGYRTFAGLCFLVSLGGLGILLVTDNIPVWFVVRTLLGFAFGSLWIVTEAWLNHVAPDEKRGRLNALFQMIYSIGFLAGPALIHLVGFAGPTPIIAMLIVAGVGILTAISAQSDARGVQEERVHLNWAVAWKARDLLAVAALGGMVETALYTLMPIFGLQKGLTEPMAINLLVAFSIGAISVALPLGWLADRLNRAALLRRCAIIATAGAFLLIPFGGDYIPAWALAFVMGGAIIGLYNVSLIVLGETYTGTKLPVVAAAFSMAYALGCGGGGAVGGFAMDVLGPDGLPLTVGGLLLAYVVIRYGLPRLMAREVPKVPAQQPQ